MSEPREKSCRECGETKPLDEFPLQKGGCLGRHPLCKPCRSAQERRRYWAHRDRILEAARNHPDRQRRHLGKLRKYGLTADRFDDMVATQAGRCAICGDVMDPPFIDHDHQNGRVRGLLCSGCNFAVGQLGDDPLRAEAAADHLERFRP